MVNRNIDEEIHRRIDEFVGELSELVRQAALESVQEALGAEAHRGPGRPPKKAPGRRGPGRPPGSKGRGGRGGKRSAEELERLSQALKHQITRNPGSRIEHISAEMGLPSKELALPLRKLLADKEIKKRGQKRATAYYPR